MTEFCPKHFRETHSWIITLRYLLIGIFHKMYPRIDTFQHEHFCLKANVRQSIGAAS